MIGETSPETVNGLITAWLTISQFIDTAWPGMAALAAVALALAWKALRRANRLTDRIQQETAHRGQIRDEQQQMADLSNAIDQAPLIPTRHGCDRQALDACRAIWDADSRKETP